MNSSTRLEHLSNRLKWGEDTLALVIFSAIDNLVKGASGQAIQNMNLIYDFPEHLGLK